MKFDVHEGFSDPFQRLVRGGLCSLFLWDMKRTMDTLIACPCGHTLASHDAEGCFGERLRSCHCRRDRSTALDAAVSVVRTPQVPAGYDAAIPPA